MPVMDIPPAASSAERSPEEGIHSSELRKIFSAERVTVYHANGFDRIDIEGIVSEEEKFGLADRLAQLVRTGDVAGVRDIRDETRADRVQRLEIVIETGSDATLVFARICAAFNSPDTE